MSLQVGVFARQASKSVRHSFLTYECIYGFFFFFFSSRRRHTRCLSDWSSDVCSSDLASEKGFASYLDTQCLIYERDYHVGPGDFDFRIESHCGPIYCDVKEIRDSDIEIGRASCRERV